MKLNNSCDIETTHVFFISSWNWTILVTLKLLMFSSFHHEIEQFLWHWNYSCFLHFITKLNNSCDIETTHVFFISSRNWTILVTLKQLMFSSFHYEIEQFLWHWNYSCFLHFIMKSNNSCCVETTHVFFISLWNWTILVVLKLLMFFSFHYEIEQFLWHRKY
jgi:hypothetical protein